MLFQFVFQLPCVLIYLFSFMGYVRNKPIIRKCAPCTELSKPHITTKGSFFGSIVLLKILLLPDPWLKLQPSGQWEPIANCVPSEATWSRRHDHIFKIEKSRSNNAKTHHKGKHGPSHHSHYQKGENTSASLKNPSFLSQWVLF